MTGACTECGFDAAALPWEAVAPGLRSLPDRYRAVLADVPDRSIRAHPITGTWSALEYTCHLRDVLDVQSGRLRQALAEERPHFTPMGREERVERDGYNDQDTAAVLEQLGVNAERLATQVEALRPAQRERPVHYNYPEPAERTVAWFLGHTVHEGRHHLMDVHRVLIAAEAR